MQLPTPGRASSRAVPMAPSRWSPAAAALYIGLQDRLSPLAERMGHSLRITEWAQVEFASGQSRPVRSSERSEPFDYIFAAYSSFGRLNMPISFFWGVTLVGLAVAFKLGGWFRVSASERTAGHLPHVSGSRTRRLKGGP